jgi:hypothetical protein
MEPGKTEKRKKYGQDTLNIRAAEFYRHMRKPRDSWKTVDDLSAQMAEFNHLVLAGAYDQAFDVLEEISSHLFVWGQYIKTEKMRIQLLEKMHDPVKRMINKGKLGIIHGYMGRTNEALKYLEAGVYDAERLGKSMHKGRFLGMSGIVKCMI